MMTSPRLSVFEEASHSSLRNPIFDRYKLGLHYHSLFVFFGVPKHIDVTPWKPELSDIFVKDVIINGFGVLSPHCVSCFNVRSLLRLRKRRSGSDIAGFDDIGGRVVCLSQVCWVITCERTGIR